jgi:hypothetical protein
MERYFVILIVLSFILVGCGTKEESGTTSTRIGQPCPPCQPCPDVAGKLYDGPPCIYDDLMGYKRFRITYDDGRVCYGIKPYGKTDPTFFTCIEKGK